VALIHEQHHVAIVARAWVSDVSEKQNSRWCARCSHQQRRSGSV